MEDKIIISVCLTKECNLDCSYCAKKSLKYLDQEDKFDEDLFYKYCKENKIEQIQFSGGEPLLKKDLLKRIITNLKDKGYILKLATNGILLDRDIIHFLNENNITVMISAHGAIYSNFDLINQIKSKYINMVIQPSELFSNKIIELSKKIPNLRIEVNYNLKKLSEITVQDLNILQQEMILALSYAKVTLNFCSIKCDKCFKKLYQSWETDNKIVLPDDNFMLSEGCTPKFKKMNSEVFLQLLEISKFFETIKDITKINNIQELFEYNIELLKNNKMQIPLILNNDLKYVWDKLFNLYKG